MNCTLWLAGVRCEIAAYVTVCVCVCVCVYRWQRGINEREKEEEERRQQRRHSQHSHDDGVLVLCGALFSVFKAIRCISHGDWDGTCRDNDAISCGGREKERMGSLYVCSIVRSFVCMLYAQISILWFNTLELRAHTCWIIMKLSKASMRITTHMVTDATDRRYQIDNIWEPSHLTGKCGRTPHLELPCAGSHAHRSLRPLRTQLLLCPKFIPLLRMNPMPDDTIRHWTSHAKSSTMSSFCERICRSCYELATNIKIWASFGLSEFVDWKAIRTEEFKRLQLESVATVLRPLFITGSSVKCVSELANGIVLFWYLHGPYVRVRCSELLFTNYIVDDVAFDIVRCSFCACAQCYKQISTCAIPKRRLSGVADTSPESISQLPKTIGLRDGCAHTFYHRTYKTCDRRAQCDRRFLFVCVRMWGNRVRAKNDSWSIEVTSHCIPKTSQKICVKSSIIGRAHLVLRNFIFSKVRCGIRQFEKKKKSKNLNDLNANETSSPTIGNVRQWKTVENESNCNSFQLCDITRAHIGSMATK